MIQLYLKFILTLQRITFTSIQICLNSQSLFSTHMAYPIMNLLLQLYPLLMLAVLRPVFITLNLSVLSIRFPDHIALLSSNH